MKLQRKGFLLVFALLITVLISLISITLLGIRRGSYASSQATVNAIQARALARSGISDVWSKLSNDPYFPGGLGDEQKVFSYREVVVDSSGDNVGSYRVTINREHRHDLPTHGLNILRIEVTGIAGFVDSESSQHTIYTELSNEFNDFRFKVWEEGVTPKL